MDSKPIGMKKILIYLIPIIVAIALFDGIKSCDAPIEEGLIDSTTEAVSILSGDNTIDSDFFIPRQFSSHQVIPSQIPVKRANNLLRYKIVFLKVGRVIHVGIGNNFPKNTLILYSSFIKPTYRLAGFGKLII